MASKLRDHDFNNIQILQKKSLRRKREKLNVTECYLSLIIKSS